MAKESEVPQKDRGGHVNDDGKLIRIDEQKEHPKSGRLGTNPEPTKPKPEPKK